MRSIRSVLLTGAVGVLFFSVVGCAETDQGLYLAGDPGDSTFMNSLRMPVYLGGCAPFVTERRLDGSWIEIGPPFVCVWEGIAVEIGPYASLTTPFQAPAESGLYRHRYDVSGVCEPNLPLSQASCEFERVIYTNEFEVERELCDLDEFGCRFIPGAPNFLCADGIHYGGPSGDCTRDPATRTCGYEFLICP